MRSLNNFLVFCNFVFKFIMTMWNYDQSHLLTHEVPLFTDEIDPIVLFHGLGGSKLEYRHNDEYVPPRFWCHGHSKWTNLWMNAFNLVPFFGTECFSYNAKINWDPTTETSYNNPGVEIRVVDFGGTAGVEHLSSFFPKSMTKYMSDTVKFFESRGYEKGKTIRSGNYDWRLSGQGLEKSGTFNMFKNLIEETYRLNNNSRCHLLAHSLGGQVVRYFLTLQSQEWKDKYVKSFFSLSGSYDGGVEALATLIQGKYSVMPLNVRDLMSAMPSVFWTIPKLYPNKDHVFLVTDERNYTIAEIPQLLTDMGLEKQISLYNYVHELDPRIPPNVRTFCFEGTGNPTPKVLYFPNLKLGSEWKVLEYSEGGDGSISRQSSSICGNWATTQNQDVDVFRFRGEDFKKQLLEVNRNFHRFFPSDLEVMSKIYEIIRNPENF